LQKRVENTPPMVLQIRFANAQVILLLPLAILSQEMRNLKKRKRIYEEIKRGKCPKPQNKRKS
jgi:hypothetical protein